MTAVSWMNRPVFEAFVLLVSRCLLALLFLHEGVFLILNFEASAAAVTKLGVPLYGLVATIFVQMGSGLAIAVGYHARLGAAFLGLFCVATALVFHSNFALRNELLHFEKDFAIAGGMFVLVWHGAGRWSIDGVLGFGRAV